VCSIVSSADQPPELRFAIEVEQESASRSVEQVAEQLWGSGGRKALRRLGFDNDHFVDDEVDFLSSELFTL